MSRRWLLRRVASSLVVLAAVLVLNFLLFRLMPGDAVSSIIDPSFSPEAKANLRALYGLDRPLWEQFVIYIKQMLTFSFGLSFMSRRPVWDELLSRLPVTLTLTVSSMFISSLLGTWLGVKAAVNRGKFAEKLVLRASALTSSFPGFFVQLVLLMIFARALPLFPLRGTLSVPPPAGGFALAADYIWHMALPVLSLSLMGFGGWALYVRNLKRVYLAAAADGLATAGGNPFGGIDVSYRAKKERNRLTPREVVRLRYMDMGALSPSALFARDVFLFSVVTRGMTGGDIFRLTADSIKGGTLSYTSSLTGRRETVGWTPLMQEIVDRHARPGTPYLFPVITAADPQEQWRQHSVALHNINRNLKRVGQMLGLSFPLNMTVAHHSWDAMERVTNASELM